MKSLIGFFLVLIVCSATANEKQSIDDRQTRRHLGCYQVENVGTLSLKPNKSPISPIYFEVETPNSDLKDKLAWEPIEKSKFRIVYLGSLTEIVVSKSQNAYKGVSIYRNDAGLDNEKEITIKAVSCE